MLKSLRMIYDVSLQHEVTVMTPEEALRNILSLVDGSDEVEDLHALQILLQTRPADTFAEHQDLS
jgi:hypothetical protein